MNDDFVHSSPLRAGFRSTPIWSSTRSSSSSSSSNNTTITNKPTGGRYCSLGQVIVFAALGCSFAVAALTALSSAHYYSAIPPYGGRNLIQEEEQHPDSREYAPQQQYADHQPPAPRLRQHTTRGEYYAVVDPQPTFNIVFPPKPPYRKDQPHPKVAWLMSFPNSGTSFTIHMTREASNCTTATNYGLEGEIRDKPSQQAIQGPKGVNGPWLELIPGLTTRVADTILTKTHCGAFCSGCGAIDSIHTPRAFMMACLSGRQGKRVDGTELQLVDSTYDKALVSKAIHIFRHPLDNVVSRFHNAYHREKRAGNTTFTKEFPKNAGGFRHWCANDDKMKEIIDVVDNRLRGLMERIPCFNEFFRYTQWHNLAFDTTEGMALETMVMHYHEYSDNAVKTRDRVLNFLELPLVGMVSQFEKDKVYHNYYTQQQKHDIRAFLQEFATSKTWEQLKRYSFD